ncbi:MAG: leucine-rich repeat domain-containing protein [Roseburia sp.]
MARTDTLTNFLTDVAAAIKAKKGDTTAIPAANFDTEIANLPSGDNSVLKSMIERTATSVEIPNDITAIGDYAFCGYKSLKNITIPDSVTSIGNMAFQECHGLTSITIPDSVSNIGDAAFHNCAGLTSIDIPSGVTSINGDMFSYCSNLTTVTIPDGVTSIGVNTFYMCSSLASIVMPSSIEYIGDSAFYYCRSLLEIDFSEHTSIPSIEYQTFWRIPDACTIKVPSALLDEWKGATNWSEYADQIVGV